MQLINKDKNKWDRTVIQPKKENDSLAELTPQQAIITLQQEGYRENFSMESSCVLYGADMDIRYHPDDFRIDKTFRFNDHCGPGGNPIVYAITARTGVKGILVDQTGTCALSHGSEEKDYVS